MTQKNETELIIFNVAVSSMKKYKIHENLDSAVKDLTAESYIIFSEYDRSDDRNLYLKKRLYRYLYNKSYEDNKFCNSITSEFPSNRKSVEKQVEEEEVKNLVKEFKKVLKPREKVIFNNLLDKSYSIKNLNISQQRLSQIRHRVKRSFKSFLLQKNYKP